MKQVLRWAVVAAVMSFCVLSLWMNAGGTVSRPIDRISFRPVLSEYTSPIDGMVMKVPPMLVDNMPVLRSIDRLMIPAAVGGMPDAVTIPTPLPPKFDVPLTYDGVVSPTAQKPLWADYANSALDWMLPIIAPILAALIADLVIKIRTYFGQSTSDAQRDKIKDMAENGVNLAAHELGKDLQSGKLSLPDRSQIMAAAVDYVQAHGADTIKALGLDPTDPKAVQAIKGHIATIIAGKQADATPSAS